MKKSMVLLFILSFFVFQSYAQKVEVLYFKANLACCAARACANLEGQIKTVVERNFKNTEVVFKTIKIADAENAELVKKYDAKSQTLIIVPLKKKKATYKDVSDLAKTLARSSDEAAFEKDIVAAIKELL